MTKKHPKINGLISDDERIPAFADQTDNETVVLAKIRENMLENRKWYDVEIYLIRFKFRSLGTFVNIF